MCDLDSDLRGLPPVECCIRYGSSFFNQHVYDPSKTNATSQLPAKNSYGVQVQNQALSRFISCTTMKDFLFLVPSARLPAWHRANLLSNPDHYTSAIRLIAKLRGVEAATRTVLQLTHMSEIPIFFNCGVHIKGNNEDGTTAMCKYGVVPTESFLDDLRNWRHFYFAGRTQKPIHVSWAPWSSTSAVWDRHLRCNRLNALRLSLLLLPGKVSLRELLREICSLSYYGDIRMLVAEDRDKVEKIVCGQFGYLCAIYLPLLKHLPHTRLNYVGRAALPVPVKSLLEGQCTGMSSLQDLPALEYATDADSVYIQQDTSDTVRSHLYNALPHLLKHQCERCTRHSI